MNKKKVAITIIIAMIILALGLFIINQSIEYFFKAELLIEPCNRCIEQGYTCSPTLKFGELNLSLLIEK